MEQEKESFFKEPLKSKNYILDLLIIIFFSLITVIVVLVLPEGNIIRIILGIFFLLFCPGYALVSLLWPKKNDMSDLERVALSFGLSIAIVIIVGLGLNYTTWGLSLNPILFTLFGFVVVASSLSLYRRMKVPEGERFFLRFDIRLPKGELTKLDKVLTLLIIVSLIIAGSVLTYVVITPKEGERFTEFYVLDQNRTTEDYPKNLSVGENGTVIIGVANHEGGRVNYSITINLLNETEYKNDSWEFWLDLNNGEKGEINFNFSIASNGTYKLEFLLFREIDNNPYLEIHLNDIIVRD